MNGYMNGFLSLILWLSFPENSYYISNPEMYIEKNYRAAKYSMKIDLSEYLQNFPEVQYDFLITSTISYKYIIQYGPDTLIEIIDPGRDFKSFAGCIRISDYNARVSAFTCFKDYERTYHTTTDSITYAIEESRGLVTYSSHRDELIPNCDSLIFKSYSTNTEYKIVFNDTIANLHSKFLFYPDVKYLPKKICGIGPNKENLILEEVIYGKSAIDSLLQQYDYNGYEQITDEDMSEKSRQYVRDILKKYKSKE